MLQYLKNIYHGLVALFFQCWYGFPSSKLTVIGVTGTDGKTTTTHLIHHLLKSAGKKAGMISSVYAEIGGKQYDTGFHVTTPDPQDIPKYLRQAVDAGENYMVLETTSHALDQNRVVGIDYAIGVITNVTHEHLDYHKTYTDYLKSKEKLLQRAETAVLNKDDESYRLIDLAINRKVITYGIKQEADVTPEKFPFTTSLPGEYNRYNCLAAIAVCKELGISDEKIRKGLETFVGVKGRFEQIANNAGLKIIIDFAHTPNAIKQVLLTIKPGLKGKLIHVFGSAGLRDQTKRPMMGENSARFADMLVLTEEDYRIENVNEIIDAIAQGAFKAGAIELDKRDYKKAWSSKKPVVFRVPDRQEAVTFAIAKLAKKGDTIILTGKAHEKSLCRGTVEYQWSEHEAVKKALSLLSS